MFFKRSTVFFLGVSTLATVTFSSCKKDDGENEPSYSVPETYKFENVDYSGQLARMDMLDELGAEMAKGTTQEVDATVLKNMFSNTGSPFSSEALNTSGKDLQSKTASGGTIFEDFLDSVATASKFNGQAASNGVAGIVTREDNGSEYLVSANGIEYRQVVLKGLMGATFYYQATSSYLSDAKIGDDVDNSEVTPGKGTKMEHHWDEAFGYFGAPIDFPSNTNDLRYWAGYAKKVGFNIEANEPLMDAFIKGRAAISNDDMETKTDQIAIVKKQWERIVAASLIHELNAAKSKWSDEAARLHYLSEAIGFTMALQYNDQKTVSDELVNKALGYLGFPSGSLYDVSESDVNNAITAINAIFGFSNVNSI